MSRREAVGLGIAVAACLAAGGIGSVFTVHAIPTWYATLLKPSWNPPGWVFGPVWTALYLLMGVAAWLVWRAVGWPAARRALLLFAAQLVLNTAWSPIFFGLRSPGWALVDIVVLWAAVVATLGAFRRIRPVAGVLLIPYLVWVTFASALNWSIWRLN